MTKKGLKYSFYVLFHPLDGFWDLKNEKRGQLSVAILYLGLWFLTNIIAKLGSGFLFNPDYDVPLDIFMEFRSVFLLFALFTIANWSITTLMDGKGYYKDIVMVFGYACLPMTLVRIPAIILSNVLSTSETIYYNFLIGFAWTWFLVLLFLGIMMVHDYSFIKAIGTLVLTAASMLVITFLAMVFYNIFSVLLSFVMAAYKELSMRV